ncbi:DUF4116 domain-containing protein [Ramlibacter sp. AW1]|uniref:DUF4116 domain-containing protein n=1 Tax=Ramlibacter aurantiacus TaxID=2801330 RepID=A0A936ZNB3_9BURK|nr:DUF4116 domain-containing protein [Ramlibacter aurantiacus]MBL0422897.1 DUF4116 domain-containing protein [Ramlibacter aurantiacus]
MLIACQAGEGFYTVRDTLAELLVARGETREAAQAAVGSKAVTRELLDQNPCWFADVPRDLCEPAPYILPGVTRNGLLLERVRRDEKEHAVCLAAVRNNGLALQFVHPTRRYRDICLAAVRNNGLAMEWVPPDLCTAEMYLAAVAKGWPIASVPQKFISKAMYLAAVAHDHAVLASVKPDWLDAEMYLSAIRGCGKALLDVPQHERTDEMYRAAVDTWGMGLPVVPPRLRDKPVCLAAVRDNPLAIRRVPDALQGDPDIVRAYREPMLALLRENGSQLIFLPRHLRDMEMCVTAVRSKASAVSSVPKELVDDVSRAVGPAQPSEPASRTEPTDKVECVVGPSGLSEYPLSPEEYLARAADPGADFPRFHLVPRSYYELPGFLAEMVLRRPELLWEMPEHRRQPDVCLVAVRRNGLLLQHVPPERKTDAICVAALLENPGADAFLPRERDLSAFYQAFDQALMAQMESDDASSAASLHGAD